MPKGGLARRATAIEQVQGNHEGTLLILDAGSSLAGQWASLKSEGRVMVEGMDAMGYDALAVGRMDMAIGLDALLQRAEEAEMAILSANIVSKEDGSLFFEPYTIIERDGETIGIIGLSEDDAIEAPGVPDRAKTTDPVEAAKQYVEELRPDVDLLVVLSHLGLDADLALAKRVPGIDVIVGGNTRKLMRQPERVGNTLVIQQGYRGEWLGRLNATFVEGEPVQYNAEILTLDQSFADDEAMSELLASYREKYPTPTPKPTWTPDPRTPTVDWEATSEAFMTRSAETAVAATAAAKE